MVSNSGQPTCLGKIYEELGRKPVDIYEEVHGGHVGNVRVSVERLENVRDSDETLGIKWAWSRCGCSSDCERRSYVRFRSGNVKTRNGDGHGDMEPGKVYVVEGNTMLNYYGTLIITNLQFISETISELIKK